MKKKSELSLLFSMRSRRLYVVGTRKNGRARRRHARGELAPSPPGVSPSRVPVLSFAHILPTQAIFYLIGHKTRAMSIFSRSLMVSN